MLFIIIHQVYELWFKELLHEFDRVMALLRADEASRAQHTLKRILTILKVMVAQLDILETMTPLEFLSFPDLWTIRASAVMRSRVEVSAATHAAGTATGPARRGPLLASRGRATLA